MKLRYILIPLFFFFLMSHNASALDLTINLNDYENLNYSVSPDYYDYVITNSSGTVVRTCSKTYVCEWHNDEQLRVAKTDKTFSLKTGDIITYNIIVYSTSNLATVNYLQWRQLTPGGGVSNLYFHKVNDFEGISAYMYGSSGGTYNITETYKYAATYEIANIITQDGTYSLGSFNQNTVDGVLQSSNNYFAIGISGFNVYRKKASSSINQEQEEATQEASDDSENTSNEANQDVESGTSNLLDVFGGFVSAITGASASNCVVNAPLNTTFSSDRLNVDLCALDLPTPIGVLTSIIAILVVVPFAISMFNKFIGIIGSFQQ